jgi:hypothetical protein
MYLEMAGLDSSTFERDFEVARETLPRRLTKASEQRGRAFSASASARSGGHPVFCRHTCMDHFTCQHVIEVGVRKYLRIFYRKFDACACSRYQAFAPSYLRRPGNEAKHSLKYIWLTEAMRFLNVHVYINQ